MKITGIATIAFAYQQPGRIGSERQTACLIELKAGAELTGIAVVRSDLAEQISRLAKELLVGADLRGVTGLWQRMLDADPVSESAAALDVALWDLKAKANGEPLWKTLGGSRPRVNTHLGGSVPGASDDELRDWFISMGREFGFRGGVLRVGSDVETEVRRVGLMREALQAGQNEAALMIQADERWSPDQAIQFVTALEQRFDLTWVETATQRTDAPGLKRISSGISAAVCGGEGLVFPSGFRSHFQHRSLDIVKIDISRCGITGSLQLADAAFGFELPVVLCASPGNLGAHLAATLPYCMSLEVADPRSIQGDLATEVRIEEGWAVASDRPGNGLALNRTAGWGAA